ncbi:MAG: hypothetical protein UY44_C0001G0017 [Candidatus Kaiserbacteria bacterium GW2011_GWA2_49_19]|uniref:Uncharacterized protein n=1 Tax=Candidatus Kaiserbacteria bacterium GW2011_GWA2_49_19 TaxID=1618669 RepID=A0A0G1Y3I6_9BACT|nr:MAG: hypothetical protein UY44_C0001G0017 [Candidatus Kaiserbacteria bacterium GW2011_GWA2_49_19]
MTNNTLCDKCGLPTPRGNDVRTFCAIMQEENGNTMGGFLFWAAPHARHFLPVIAQDGKILCEGSPSRAQYIEGQPRDTRPEFAYSEKREWLIRKAFVQMHTETLAPA